MDEFFHMLFEIVGKVINRIVLEDSLNTKKIDKHIEQL